jgi:hypothetical protein
VSIRITCNIRLTSSHFLTFIFLLHTATDYLYNVHNWTNTSLSFIVWNSYYHPRFQAYVIWILCNGDVIQYIKDIFYISLAFNKLAIVNTIMRHTKVHLEKLHHINIKRYYFYQITPFPPVRLLYCFSYR